MMNQRADAGNRPASTIEAAFSHAEAFDFIDLRIAFDGIVFSSSPISANTYDGPWEDITCPPIPSSSSSSTLAIGCSFASNSNDLRRIPTVKPDPPYVSGDLFQLATPSSRRIS